VDFAKSIAQLEDTLTVVIGIQERQARVQKLQAEELDALRTFMIDGFKRHEERMDHIDERLAEITDKLDGLIGFMDNYFKRPKE
jgi:hypothetical protein